MDMEKKKKVIRMVFATMAITMILLAINAATVSADATTEIGIKVKDKDGKERDVHIEVDENANKGKIKVDEDVTELTDLKKCENGHEITGKTTHWWVGDLTVMFFIDCKKTPPEIRIVAKDKEGKVRVDDTYTFTHKEQDRLIEWLKKLKVPTYKTKEIPEFPTIAIPVVTMLGLLFWISRRKQKR